MLNYLYHALFPRAYHEEFGSDPSRMFSWNGLKLVIILAIFNVFVIRFIGPLPTNLSQDPSSVVVGIIYVVLVLFIPAVIIFSVYLLIVSRESILSTIPRHIYGLLVYLLPYMISLSTLNVLHDVVDEKTEQLLLFETIYGEISHIVRGNRGSWGYSQGSETMTFHRALEEGLLSVDVIFMDISTLLFFIIHIGGFISAAWFLYLDSRYHHHLNRVEAAIPALVIPAMIAADLLWQINPIHTIL